VAITSNFNNDFTRGGRQFIPEDIELPKPEPKGHARTSKDEKFAKRERGRHEATAITNAWVLTKEPYKIGDGDTHIPRRPGSDHSHLKSHGTLC